VLALALTQLALLLEPDIDASAAGERVAQAQAPELRVYLDGTRRWEKQVNYGFAPSPSVVSVRRQTSKEPTVCIPSKTEEPAPAACTMQSGWFQGEGEYVLRLEPRGDARFTAQEFSVEVASSVSLVSVLAEVPESGADPPAIWRSVRRLRMGPTTITVKPKANADPEALSHYGRSWQRPVFELRNGSAATIFPAGARFFQGSFERRVDDRWSHIVRGGFCGNVAAQDPVPSGGTAHSGEGAFIGGVDPLEPGHYRYVVGYGFRPRDSAFGSVGVVEDVWLAAYEFDVPTRAADP
jgi:hypothetical protein